MMLFYAANDLLLGNEIRDFKYSFYIKNLRIKELFYSCIKNLRIKELFYSCRSFFKDSQPLSLKPDHCCWDQS